ncbi:3'-5' exonuclease [Clostridium autoethanogenum]|uniref:3'-5' exonuclease n=2 Tax=Clostridium autoethanogenum TaxID=84023 RepID=A0A3M0SW19_9CLOT|nr:3'-5' exonuclease [Clostridium autoethanogenum]AGY78249.1 3'-5' exonuclease [Clostridium autoethanogenum DSM 10061]ALU38381.1 Exonuclease RNase T and DNA polymerase III [Clostridium autoethanogenum DSM 10061]OVY51137.1 DNA polymerase III PolC-type [Clostridium autoethanogenum]RMD02506.1 3'-5' exonuclease [Clostridium autoethanogenum]
MNMIFFDTETTGLRPGNICQLSYILVDTSEKPTKTIGKNIFFAVDYIEPSAEKVHGFTVETLYKLSSGMNFKDHLDEFLNDFQNADILIGHNVNFDIKFLSSEFKNCNEILNIKHTFCTMNYYKNICNLKNRYNKCKAPRLEEVVRFLHIENPYINAVSKKYFNGTGNFHDARFDTTATYLLVTEGIKKGYIPKRYFSHIIQ